MVSSPVARDEALEAQFCLEDAVHEFAVLATVAVVRTLIRAHETCCAGLETVHERENVKLVNGAIVHIGAQRLALRTGIAAVLLGAEVSDMPQTLCARNAHLLVEQPVLGLNNHTLLLYSNGNLLHTGARKIWISSKSFPVPAGTSDPTKRSSNRKQSDVYSLLVVL